MSTPAPAPAVPGQTQATEAPPPSPASAPEPGRALITGGSGFIGRHLIPCLHHAGWEVHATRRGPGHAPQISPDLWLDIPQIDDRTPWNPARLQGVDVLIHLACLAHIPEDDEDPALYHRINTQGTLHLARAAAAAGVRRLLFVSSVKVYGPASDAAQPLTEDSPCQPDEPYGRSKLAAEQGLQEIAAETGMEVTILRPCLVYGPGVKANFLELLDWVANGRPVPACRKPAVRSMIGIGNLCHLIELCLRHPVAANATFNASDGEDLSTCDLARLLARRLGRRHRRVVLPQLLLRLAGELAGHHHIERRLCRSLRVSAARAREQLGWQPPLSVQQEIARTTRWYVAMGDLIED